MGKKKKKEVSANPWEAYTLTYLKDEEDDYELCKDGKRIATVRVDKFGNTLVNRAYRVRRATIQQFESDVRLWATHHAPRYSAAIKKAFTKNLVKIWVRAKAENVKDPCRILSVALKPKPAKVPRPTKPKDKPVDKTDSEKLPKESDGPVKVKRAEILRDHIGPAFTCLRQGYAMSASLAAEGVLYFRRARKDMTKTMMLVSEWAQQGLLDVDDLKALVRIANLPYCVWSHGPVRDNRISIMVAPPTSENSMKENLPFSKVIRLTFIRQPPMGEVLVGP